MDRFALAGANLLVGNPEGAAALECALSGPSLTALIGCLVAVTGADFQATLNGRPMPTWEGVFVAPGDRLEFAGRSWGARVYVAVAGGLAGDRWLGSVATYLLAGRGGIHGRPLKAGDVLAAGGPPPRPLVAGRALPPPLRPPYGDHAELLTIAGPHVARKESAVAEDMATGSRARSSGSTVPTWSPSASRWAASSCRRRVSRSC